LPAGLTVVILAAQFATLTDATAELAGPLVVALALSGLLLAPWWRPRPTPWASAAAAGVFAVFAAPVVLSGRATFAGYIKLDDTATYLAMTDRVMEHGRSLAGLAPSTYEATLATTLAIGYPTGSLMPLGLGHQLLAYDSAWLYQPYLTFLAALLALALYAVLGRAIPSPRLRALAAFLAAQPAILYGYALWGGIKELAGALLLALIGALVPWTLAQARGPRAAIPLAAACATVVCVLSLPGAFWLVTPLLAAGAFILRRPSRSLLRKAGAFVAALAVLGVPAYVAAVDWLPRIGAFDKASNLGNLIGPLSGWQLFGIWPIGDFRVRPHHWAVPTYALIAVVLVAGLAGLWWAWRSRAWALLVYVTTSLIGCLVFVGISSPWVGGKTIAMASPAVLAAALTGCAALLARGRSIEAAVVVLAIAGGVLWSNVDQYHDVWLAPQGQLHELETIGRDFSGDGPALMTVYEPYGVRHFLRRLDPEGASELRRRFDYLTNGTMLDKGESADIDRIRLDQVLVYRTLVLRRGPTASRPPSVYRLVWSGRYYEVWQRPEQPRTISRHIPLGSTSQAAAVPPCPAVEALRGSELVTATRPEAIGLGAPPLPGTAALRVSVPVDGVYTAWIAGDWFGLASVSIDGRTVGSKREELNWPGLYTDLGSTPLAAGAHDVTISYGAGGWHPGSGGDPYAFGPVALSLIDARDPVTRTPPRDASSLCGHPWDWVEALR
jgi:hypothetical protein